MRMTFIIGLGLGLGVGGCDKGGGTAAPAGSAAATGAAAAPAAKPAGPKTSLTQAQIDEAYNLTDADKVDKSITDVTAKLGAPQKTEGDAVIWYGIGKDGASCYQLKIAKVKGIESGTVDKANCGL